MACHHAWVHADRWILTAKLAFFVALGYLRFVGGSRPASRRYREPLKLSKKSLFKN